MQISQGKDTERSCRSRPRYRSASLGWISGVALPSGTLTRSARPVQGFTVVRCWQHASGFFPTGLDLKRFNHRIATLFGCIRSNLNRKALAFLRLASIRLMLRKLCNPA